MSTLRAEGVRREGAGYLPAAIALESDGAQNRGRAMPKQAAAQARAAGVRVYGVALGTPGGALAFGGGGIRTTRIPVPPDTQTVSAVARATGGEAYAAQTTARARQVYATLAGTLAG